MAYEHQVFISYNRDRLWESWLRKLFLPTFRDLLSEQFPPLASVFFDSDLTVGDVYWPPALATAAANSSVLVPLFTNRYFFSEWCTAELAHFTAREEACGYRTLARPRTLVLPIVLSGGQYFPASINGYTKLDLSEYANPYLNTESDKAQRLYDAIRSWAPSVFRAVSDAPPYEETWNTLAWQTFQQTYKQTAPATIELPNLGAA
jgi:hypothetical protein